MNFEKITSMLIFSAQNDFVYCQNVTIYIDIDRSYSCNFGRSRHESKKWARKRDMNRMNASSKIRVCCKQEKN